MQIDYKGDPVSGKDKKEIERMISYEVAFYSQFGLSDTLVIQLHVFDDKRDGSYILSHALVTFWIEKQSDVFKKLVSSLQKKEDVCSVFERIDRIYPGGFSKLEEDFAAFCR